MTRLAIHGGTPVRGEPFPPQATIGDEERAAVLEVLDSGVLSQFIAEWGDDFLGGPRVRRAEQAYAHRLGAAHAVAVNSATTGLQTAVAACGIRRDDEVIVSPFTMSASASVVVMHGATPVFADVEQQTYGLDPAAVAERISPRTRAILVTHLFGHPARIDPLLELAREHELAVIEDAAQSIGATTRERETATIGTAGVLSLNYHKIIHAGEGGIVVTNDADVALRAQLVRNHAEVSVDESGVGDATLVGSNFRMTEIEAAIAHAQLAKLEGLLAVRRRLAERLRARLAGLPGLVPPVVADGCTHSWYLFAIRLDLAALEGVSRADLAAALEAEGIPLGVGYVPPIYSQPLYQRGLEPRHPTWDSGSCPVTERLWEHELLVGDFCRVPLTERDVDDVADAFEKVLGELDAVRRPAA